MCHEGSLLLSCTSKLLTRIEHVTDTMRGPFYLDSVVILLRDIYIILIDRF